MWSSELLKFLFIEAKYSVPNSNHRALRETVELSHNFVARYLP